MTELEQKILIVEFMGGKFIKEDENNFNHFIYENRIVMPYRLKLTKDWNELMKVIDKINELGYDFNIGRIKCSVSHLLGDEIVSWVCGDLKNKFDLTLTTVVDFIKWYNNNK